MIRSTSKRQRTSIKEENLDIDNNKKRILSVEGDQAAIEMEVAEESSSSHSPSMSADAEAVEEEEESDDLFSTTTKIGGTIISEKKVTKSQRIALKNMEQKLICPLCKNIMREPVTLMNCLHSFCMECLAKHYYSIDDSNDDDGDDNNNCKNQDQSDKEQSENDTKADASKVIDGEVESSSSSSSITSSNNGGIDINLSQIIEKNSVTRGDVLVCPIADCKVPLLLYNNNNKSNRSSRRSSTNSSSCNTNSCVKKNPQLTTMISSFHGILENLSKIRDTWWNANVEEEEEINDEGQSDEQCVISNMDNCDDDIKKNETEKQCINKSENPQTILPESIDDESSITIDDKNDVNNNMNNGSSSISDSLTGEESNNGDDNNNDNKEENCVIEKIERVKSDDNKDDNSNSDVESYDSDNSDDKTIVNSYHYSQFSQFSGVTFGASK